MNEIIALNGGILLNPSGIRKHFHVLTQGVGIHHDPAELYGSRWDRRHSATQQSYRSLLCECPTRHYSISDVNDNTLYFSAIG